MKNIKKQILYSLVLCFCFCLQVGFSQQRGEETIKFDFIDCPKVTVKNITGSTSTTLAKNRTKIGVGEEVEFIASSDVKWEIASGKQSDDNLDVKNARKANFEASVNSGVVIIRATPIGKSCPAVDIPLTVIAPEEVSIVKKCGYHTKDEYEVGLVTEINFLLPNTVSFGRLSVREESSIITATGALSDINNTFHNAATGWLPTFDVVDNQGTFILLSSDDAYWGLNPGQVPASTIGSYSTSIPWSYAKSNNKSLILQMSKKVLQEGILNGTTLISRKKAAEHNVQLSDPTVLPIMDPTGSFAIGCK